MFVGAPYRIVEVVSLGRGDDADGFVGVILSEGYCSLLGVRTEGRTAEFGGSE